MIDDERFEIQSAFDLLPHVVGCSWATIWFRLNKIKKPTREEFREKVTEYFKMLDPLVNVYPQGDTQQTRSSLHHEKHLATTRP